MQLEREVKKFKKSLYIERDRLNRDLAQINHVIDAVEMNGNRPGPRAGRKLSKAHRLAIKRGIAAKKAGRSK